MPEVIITEIDTSELSQAGLQVLKAALTYAKATQTSKHHELSIAEFCGIAGTGLLSSESMRILLREGQRVVVSIELVDTDVSSTDDIKCGSSPIFSFVATDDDFVAFEVCDMILRDIVLDQLLALTLPVNASRAADKPSFQLIK